MENLFKNANFEQHVICYDNSFIMDVIESRKVGTILKYKAHDTSPHMEHTKSFHEKLGIFTQRRLAIILKFRSKLTPFFYAIFENSDLPPIIGSEIREKYPGCLMDFNLTDEETVHVTTQKILNRRAMKKDFVQSFFAKSPSIYKDLKRLHRASMGV